MRHPCSAPPRVPASTDSPAPEDGRRLCAREVGNPPIAPTPDARNPPHLRVASRWGFVEGPTWAVLFVVIFRGFVAIALAAFAQPALDGGRGLLTHDSRQTVGACETGQRGSTNVEPAPPTSGQAPR